MGESHKNRSIELLCISASSPTLAKEIGLVLGTAGDSSGCLLCS